MFAGSVRWMSPERIQPARFGLTPASSRTLAGDVYSLAMTLYEIFTLTLPYHELTQMDVPRAIVSGDRPPHPGDAAVQLGLTDDMWNFMRKCWSEQPHDRPDLAILSDDSDESKSDNEDTDDGKAPPANIETFSPETSNPKIDTNVPTKATEVTGPASFGVDKVPPSVLTQDPVPAASSGFRSQSRQSISASDSPLQQSFTQGADAAIPDIEEKSGLVTDTSVGAFNEHPTPPSSSAALASHDDKIRRLAMPKKASARDDPSRLEGAKGEDHLPSMHNILPPATAAFDTLSQQPAPPPPASDQNTIQSHGDINLPPVLPMSGGRGRATPTNDLQTTQKSEPGNDLTVREERGTSTASQTGPASLQHVVPEYGTEVKVDMEQVPPNVSPQVEPSTAPLTSTSSFKSRNPFRPRTVSQPNMEEPSFPAGRHRDVSSEGNVAAMAAANTLASTAESLSNTVVMAAQHPAVSQSVHSETVTAPIAEGRSSPDTLKASTSPAEDTSISAEHSIPTPEREVAPTTVKVPTVSNPAVPQPSAPASSAFEDIWKLLQAEIMEQKPISRPLPQHIPARPDGPPLPSIPARANSFEEVVRIEANAAGIHVPPRPSLSPSSVSARPILKRGDSKHTGHEPAKPNTRTVAWDDIVTDSERTPTGRKVGETRRDMGKMDAKTAAWDDYLTDSELTPTLRRYAPLLPRVGRLAAVEEHSTPPRRPSPVYQGSMHTPLQSSSPKPQGQLSTTVETTQSENEDESRTLSKEKTSGYMKPRSESPQTWSEVKSGVAKSIPDEIRSSSRESDYRSAVAGLVEKVHPEPTKHDQSGTSSGTTGNLIDFDDPSPAPSHAPNTSNDISWGFQHDGEVSDVMISQLDKTISKNRLKRLFERFGEVLHVNITVDSRGVSTGDACVSFANHSDALLAVQQMNDETIGTGQIQVWALGL
ncbi:hypothetical protein CALVIDRAFT_9610 [Calocera viscosa TUFC12733]|uniref:RRM domain-containing protein n=1 Tax=Calocera viscosa (strain TUFC12733) TaxID=1330018 RepID=A0A167S2L5_CALVF|nr:hypothetical protein CALVIDRAFT_9610 [Calocera viscosa TUFC12733]